MRLIVIGTLVVAALAIALLFEVAGHSQPASTTVSGEPKSAAPTVSTPVAAPALDQARPAPTVAARAPALVSAQPPVAGDTDKPGKPKHVDTPIDVLRWSLMRQIRTSEPAVIDCLDKAKAANTPVDGTAMYAFYVTDKPGKQPVIDRAGMESSPFPEAVNACIVATLAGGELDQSLPEGQTEYRVLRKLVVEKGAITQYKLQSFIPVVNSTEPQ